MQQKDTILDPDKNFSFHSYREHTAKINPLKSVETQKYSQLAMSMLPADSFFQIRNTKMQNAAI